MPTGIAIGLSRFMPFEFGGQVEPRILDMQDATVPRVRGTAGSVEEQWTHEQSVPSRDSAKKIGLLPAKLRNAVR